MTADDSVEWQRRPGYPTRLGARAGRDDQVRGEAIGADLAQGRHRHRATRTLPLAVTGCHSLGICTVILLPLRSFSVRMAASPLATPTGRSARARSLLSAKRRGASSVPSLMRT
jgi:hypothetical protein